MASKHLLDLPSSDDETIEFEGRAGHHDVDDELPPVRVQQHAPVDLADEVLSLHVQHQGGQGEDAHEQGSDHAWSGLDAPSSTAWSSLDRATGPQDFAPSGFLTGHHGPLALNDHPIFAGAFAIDAQVDASSLVDVKTSASGGKPGGGSGGGTGGTLLTTYTSGDASVADSQEFNIRIDFSGTWTAKQQAIVTWAADFLSDIIASDVRDDTDLSGSFVDDIVISMSTGRIDGSGNPLLGNTLAETRITAVRDAGTQQEWLPVTSSIKLDSTDLKNSVSGGWSGTWDDIVLHEMIHALGFAGVVFDGLGLVDAAGNFIGANAVAAYGGDVPIEGDGGAGTAGSHWDEATFMPGGVSMSNELMTGWIENNQWTYFSDTTLGALADLGYVVQDPSAGSYLTVNSGLLLA